MTMRMYERTDMSMKKLREMIRREFAKSRQMMAMDELNVIRASEKMYEKLEKANEEAFLKLARDRYKDITGEEADRKSTLAWLLLFLLAYNPVTEFIYKNEVKRKRDRFAETMVASPNKLLAIKRALSLWLRQTEQFLVLVEDEAVLRAYKRMGYKRVRWFTQVDERRCPDCAARHGKVYSINRVPPKPHRNCRCYIEPVND